MRKFGEYDLNRLSDSRLLYMRNPPRFAYIFTIVAIAILIGVAGWSTIAIKAEEVQAQGLIVTEDRGVLVPEVGGIVKEVLYREGDIVPKGSAVLRFDTTDISIDIANLERQRDRLSERISNIDLFLEQTYASFQRQPFKNVGGQAEFFVMFQQYMSDKSTPGMTAEDIDRLNSQARGSLLSDKSSSADSLGAVDSELSRCEAVLSRHSVASPISGILHLDAVISPGMMLQAGTQIGSVSGDGKKTIESYISSADRSKIDTGQECRFTVDGLAQTEYGSLRGTVESISSDAIVQEGGVYFRTVIRFDADVIHDSKGSPVAISNGMTVRAWVTYEKVTYLKYWMGQIGLDEFF
ncbi:MAG: HlyD family efflux transporter periplasmic adaptor subunit [Candidatus Methanoplasma sp.]|jgi:multidrug resistance efflux pump|nr:HlyD family efflux transporter periplasmic adaptor subunit [Candidatus Methanoplasma sp.]